MELSFPSDWDVLDGDARVWLWSSPRKLSSEQQEIISSRLGSFVTQWTSHHVALKARACTMLDHFVIVGLDESASTSASGCSIDSLTHAIQAISKDLDLDLQDRTTFFFLVDGKVQPMPMNEIEGVTLETPVVDTLVKSKKDLQENWIKPVRESWHARFL